MTTRAHFPFRERGRRAKNTSMFTSKFFRQKIPWNTRKREYNITANRFCIFADSGFVAIFSRVFRKETLARCTKYMFSFSNRQIRCKILKLKFTASYSRRKPSRCVFNSAILRMLLLWFPSAHLGHAQTLFSPACR